MSIYLKRMFFLFLILLLLPQLGQSQYVNEIIGPAGNEYIDPTHPSEDDSDQVLMDYSEFPDTVKRVIEQLLPDGKVLDIHHWGPFRYTLDISFPDGFSNKIFVYLTGKVRKILYMDGDYKERPGLFFVSDSEREIPLDSIPSPVAATVKMNLGHTDVVAAWKAESDIGLTYVIEVIGFQNDDTTAFAYRPDGVLKTMVDARTMKKGVPRKWSEEDIEIFLGKYRKKYCVDTVLSHIQSIPYNPEDGFRFVVLGDNRINKPVWEAICKSIGQKDAVFAIDVGDLVNEGEPEQYDEYLFGVLESYSKFNFLPVVGNHDIGYDGLAVSYLTSFGPNSLNYYFDYGNARFVILDNCSRVTDFQKQLKVAGKWLADTPKGFFKFVFLHVPPGDIKKWSYHAMSGKKSHEFTELMSRYKVDHVFAGHIHAYSTASYRDVEYTVTGGAGANLHTRYGPKGSVHHYVIVDVSPEGIQQFLIRLYLD